MELSPERRAQIEQEEAARVAEENYREFVRQQLRNPASPSPRNRPEREVVYSLPQPDNGVNWGKVLTWLILAPFILTGIYHLYPVSSKSKTGKASSASSSASSSPVLPSVTAPIRRLVSDPQSRSLADNELMQISAGGVRWLTFSVPPDSEPFLKLKYEATGGAGNDVQIALGSELDMKNWMNGHMASVLYSPGKRTADETTVRLPSGGGSYVLAISNKHSILSSKTVQLDAQLHWMARRWVVD